MRYLSVFMYYFVSFIFCIIRYIGLELFESRGNMQTRDIFNLLHNAAEAQNYGRKISQRDMAKRLGVSMRTYQDWRLGNSSPQAATALMQMLCELDNDEILRVVNKMKQQESNK